MVGGLHIHNHATLWPNLQERTCKNSSQTELQVEPNFGNIEGLVKVVVMKTKSEIICTYIYWNIEITFLISVKIVEKD